MNDSELGVGIEIPQAQHPSACSPETFTYFSFVRSLVVRRGALGLPGAWMSTSSAGFQFACATSITAVVRFSVRNVAISAALSEPQAPSAQYTRPVGSNYQID